MSKPKSSPLQHRQHRLAWLLYVTAGATANLAAAAAKADNKDPILEARLSAAQHSLRELSIHIYRRLGNL